MHQSYCGGFGLVNIIGMMDGAMSPWHRSPCPLNSRMAPKLGPTGKYPLGKRLEPSDRGHMDTAFSIVPPRHAKLEFGTRLDWFFLTPTTARVLTKTMRETLTRAYGPVESARTLPFMVYCNMERGVVMVDLPLLTPTITTTAEVWLALINRIEQECRKLTL